MHDLLRVSLCIKMIFSIIDNALLLGKSILTHRSIATFYYAINVDGIKLLIFGHHSSVPPTNVFLCCYYYCSMLGLNHSHFSLKITTIRLRHPLNPVVNNIMALTYKLALTP